MRKNRYDGVCCYCMKLVKAFEGVLIQFGARLSPAHPKCHREFSGKKEEGS